MTIETVLQSVDAELAKWNKLHTAILAIFQPAPKPVVHGAALDVADVREIRRYVPPVKRKLSAKGRAAIVAAAKNRWAKAKAAKKAKAKK